MAFDREKFKSLVHYICWRCNDDPSSLGAVKLNKTLWVADFTAYYMSGDAITGARYVKRKFGPVPSAIVQVVAELEAEGAIFTRDTQFHGYSKREFKVLREPNTNGFTADEISLADEAIKLVCEEHTAKSISEASHDHIWRMAEEGEELPYFTIFARPGEISEDEREWARLELESLATA